MTKDYKALADVLRARPVGATYVKNADPDKDFSSQIEVSGSTASVVIRDEPGTITEGTAFDFLTKEKLNPDEWEITSFRKSEWQSANGETLESVRYSFAKKASASGGLVLPDLDDIHKMAKEAVVVVPKKSHDGVSVITCLADAQLGKVDSGGGFVEIFTQMEKAKARWVEYVKQVQPQEILLFDLGDSVEGFECVASEDRTNDLSLSEQIRVWRRVFWSWIETAASLAPRVKIISVPSNHASIRRGRNKMGLPDDDFGIEVLAQVSDMASVYPEKFGHVTFHSPKDFHESVVVKAVGGKYVGAVHGHQMKSPNGIEQWLANQALGNNPLSHADIVLLGHYHHFASKSYGDKKTYFIAPASDPGSSWYSNNSGNHAAPGVLVMTLDDTEWSGLCQL